MANNKIKQSSLIFSDMIWAVLSSCLVTTSGRMLVSLIEFLFIYFNLSIKSWHIAASTDSDAGGDEFLIIFSGWICCIFFGLAFLKLCAYIYISYNLVSHFMWKMFHLWAAYSDQIFFYLFSNIEVFWMSKFCMSCIFSHFSYT